MLILDSGWSAHGPAFSRLACHVHLIDLYKYMWMIRCRFPVYVFHSWCGSVITMYSL